MKLAKLRVEFVVILVCGVASWVHAAGSAVSVTVPTGLGTLIQEGNGVREFDLPDRLEFLVNGTPLPATVEDGRNNGWDVPARTHWPHPEETGLLTMLGPVGPALRFTSGYLTCKGVTEVATGDHWTLACWLRPDDPDWGMTIQRNQLLPVYTRPTIAALGSDLAAADGAAPLWAVRLCQMRPELQLGPWHAWGETRLSIGRWTHVAVVRDGQEMRLYVDGKAEALTPALQADGTPAAEETLGALPDLPAQLAAAAPCTVLRLAGWPFTQSYPKAPFVTDMCDKFIGGMDGFSLENRAWSADEVREVAAAHRKEADRLSVRCSVLEDPTVGNVSRIALRAGESPEDFRQRTAWWRAAKFGLFMHWGPVSLTKKEISWSRGTGEGQTPPEVYDNLYKQWNPVKYDPNLWAEQIKAAGMKYAVLITKHHDGFCEWPTETNEYNIAFTPYQEDAVGKYVAAMRRAGVRAGFYFSGSDWWHADKFDAGNTGKTAKLDEYDTAQLRELLGNYGPIDVLWFDMWGVEFDDMKALQPKIIINDRLPGGDFVTPENFMIEHPIINPNGSDGLWETCSGTGGHWAYPSDQPGFDTAYTLRHLVEVVAKGGNWLCNVAPKETGELPTTHMDMLKQAGDWLRVNGESVYGTHRTHLGRQPFGWTTANATTLFLHVFNWPGRALAVPDLYDKATNVYLLVGKTKLPFRQEGTTLSVELPAAAPDPVDTVIAVTVTRSVRPAVVKGSFVNHATGGEATASAENGEAQGAAKACDGVVATKWFNHVAPTGWLQYEFAQGEAWAITHYSLISAEDVPERDPKDWQLQGSEDGATWVTLDEQHDQTFTARNETRTFELINQTAYPYYRLNVTANHGAPGLQLSGMRLLTVAWGGS